MSFTLLSLNYSTSGHDMLNPELHEFHCSCVSGLECRGTKVHESQHQIVHENPICQQPES